jgi:ribulose 1,5-bisphosphate synthetase/thiazole synthase
MSRGCPSTTQSERRPEMTTTIPTKKPSSTTRSTKTTSRADRTYDAIVVGGGHNGLVNGAYLAKAGL